MDWELKRLLEHAGILRRGTPTRLLLEEEDDDGGDDGGDDDIFGGGDDGGDDPFGDEDADAEGDGGGEETKREPPEELSAQDIGNYGSPRFLDMEMNLKNMYNSSVTSASAAAQHLEVYPGQAMEKVEDTPAKDEESDKEEGDDKNESFYRYGNRRDKWLIKEASRLLMEAEEEGSAADEFDMERFATELANYLDVVTQTEDVEAGIFNAARQMILNNHGPETEKEFIAMLDSVSDGKWSFIEDGFSDEPEVPTAAGATGGGGGA